MNSSSLALLVSTFPFTTECIDSTPGTATDAWWVRARGRAGGGGRGRILPNATAGGRLYQAGQPVRLWGASLCFGANFPERPLASSIAGRVYKLGFNAVRLMSLDLDENDLGPDGRWTAFQHG